jgi:hypothetical protein
VVDSRDVVGTAGLDEYGSVRIAKRAHKREDVLLKQRLTAGDLNEGTIEGQYVVEQSVSDLLTPS